MKRLAKWSLVILVVAIAISIITTIITHQSEVVMSNKEPDIDNGSTHSSYIWISTTHDWVYKMNMDFTSTGENWDSLYGYPLGLDYLYENNRIYIVDKAADVLACLTTAGVLEWSYDISAFSGDAFGLTHALGYWWIVDRGDDKVYKVDNGGQKIADFGYLGGKSFAYAEGAAWDNNYLWIVDEGDAVVRAFDISGVIDSSYSLDNVSGFTVAGATSPAGLAYDGTYFWICDGTQDKVWKVENDGTIIGGPWDFDEPEGLAYDPSPPPEWGEVETWTGSIETIVVWQLLETWTGTVEAITIWQLVETWSSTIKAPAIWQLIEQWTGTVEAYVEWQLIEDWFGTVQNPTILPVWILTETWTGALLTATLYGNIFILSPWSDGRVNPTDVTTATPGFSAIYVVVDNSNPNQAILIHIQVGTSLDENDLWDNIAAVTVENGQRSVDVDYDGIDLILNTSYWWRSRFGDSSGNWTEWTLPQTFGYEGDPFDWIATAMFIFPIVLMAMALIFDSPIFASFSGIVFIFSGLFFIDTLWLAMIFIGIGIYLLITAAFSDWED